MRAGHIPERGRVEVSDWPEPAPTRAGDVLIQVDLMSICGSDIHAIFDANYRAEAPTRAGYSGHEAVGHVIESRSPKFSVGDRVLAVPDGQQGGCFAERVVLDDAFVVGLPDGDDETLVLAQQYGTVLYAMKHFWPNEVPARSAHTGVVLGCGSAGLFFIQELQRAGFERVYAVEPEPDRLQVARDLGALTELPAGLEADLVIDAVGTTDVRNHCIDLLAPGGVIGCFGVPAGHEPEPWRVQDAFRKRARVQYCVGTQAEPELASFVEAIRRVSAGDVRTGYCTGPTFPLDDLAAALAYAQARKGHVKVFLRP